MRFVIETEDQEEHERYLVGPEALSAIWNLSEAIRANAKYDDPDIKVTWKEVRELFLEHCKSLLWE